MHLYLAASIRLTYNQNRFGSLICIYSQSRWPSFLHFQTALYSFWYICRPGRQPFCFPFSVEDDKNYNGFLDTLKTRITLHSDGKNVWLAPIMFRISCAINVAKFPFDTQICDFKFGSFTYDSTKIKLQAQNKTADFSKYSRKSLEISLGSFAI